MRIPAWARKLPWPMIDDASRKHKLEPELIASVIMVESAGNPAACRFEPQYRYTWNTRDFAELIGCTEPTMKVMQKSSYGLMQVMGGVAYEHGLHHEVKSWQRWPTALCDSELGIEYGCRHLALKKREYGEDACRIYAAYNAGSVRMSKGGMFLNQRNVDHFYKYYKELTEL